MPFSNFRAIKGIAKIRELNQRSFLMTVGISVSDKLGPYGRVSDEQVFMQEVQ